MTLITNITGIGLGLAATLAEKGIITAEQFAAKSVAQLTTVPGIGPIRAKALLTAASQLGKASPAKVNSAKAKAKKPSPAVDSAQAPVVPETSDDTADNKAAIKKAKAKAKKRAKALKAEKEKADKKAAENKAVKKRAKKAVKKKKAKKAARKALKAKAVKKAARA